MPIYQTTGHLTDSIASDKIDAAQQYLRPDFDMTQIVNDNAKLDGALELIEWTLHNDGYNYSVVAVTSRELTEAELKQLASEVSGQNSDGLGEGFEQQDFAWNPDGECGECEGCIDGWECEDDGGHMCSFDWVTNDSTFERIK